MDNLFFVKLLISFSIGAFWATFSTIIADRYGSKIGGLLVGLPSTTMFALFFIAWTQTPRIAFQSTSLMLIANAANCIFILTYTIFVKKNFWLSLFLSLISLFVVNFIFFLLKFNNFLLSSIIYLITLLFCFFIMEKVLKLPSQKGKKINYTFGNIIFRALISGFIITFATLIAKIAGPVIGGIFGNFPALILSTLIITYLSIGPLFSASTMKSSMISASAVAVYIIIGRWSYANYNLFVATLIPIMISYIYGYLLYRIVIQKIS